MALHHVSPRFSCALEVVHHNYVTTQVFQFLGKTSSHYTAIYRMGAAIITCSGNCIRMTVTLIQGVIQVPKGRKLLGFNLQFI